MPTSEEKRWAKDARLRRQALKKASLPSANLFQARIRRTEFSNRPSGNSWGWVLFVLAFIGLAGAWWMQRSSTHEKMRVASVSAASPDLAAALQSSSAPVVSAVNVSVPTVVAPAVTQAAVDNLTEAPHAVVPDTREWHAPTSGVHEARQIVLKGRNGWRAIWEELGRDEDVPRVNFYDHMVVGVFLGPRPSAGYEVQIGTPQETDRELVIPYHVVAPLPGSPLGAETTYPWQARVIVRTSKTIRFAQDPATPGPSH
jgi:hypothetical protein